MIYKLVRRHFELENWQLICGKERERRNGNENAKLRTANWELLKGRRTGEGRNIMQNAKLPRVMNETSFFICCTAKDCSVEHATKNAPRCCKQEKDWKNLYVEVKNKLNLSSFGPHLAFLHIMRVRRRFLGSKDLSPDSDSDSNCGSCLTPQQQQQQQLACILGTIMRAVIVCATVRCIIIGPHIAEYDAGL